MKPQIENAPGLVWQARKDQWKAIWRARDDLIERGFRPKNHPLWQGAELTAVDINHIQDTCNRLQGEMLAFSRGLVAVINAFDGTLRTLVNCYQTDPDSTYHKKRFAVRKNQDALLKRMVARHGDEPLSEIKGRVLKAWHKEWSHDGEKVAIGHAVIGHLRTLFGFGFTMLEDADCERLVAVMHNMKFQMPRARTDRLTADQAIAIRAVAHKRGLDSMAMAQAFQFELMLRQKDVIGEWVPMSEPGISDVVRTRGKDQPEIEKWLMGIRWEEIDQNLILRHNTSKRGKDIEVDLKLAPMVLEELALYSRTPIANLTRASLPPSGPIILCEIHAFPWTGSEFRRKWRIVANAAGVPKSVKNMDSRAGAISEATDAGANLEHVRHAATHSDISMTQRYSRGSTEKVAGVSRLRVEHRNKPKT